MPFYAVRAGKSTGIFKTWPECQKQVSGFQGAQFKKFDTIDEANAFINGSINTSTGTQVNTQKRSKPPLGIESILPPVKISKRTYSSKSKYHDNIEDVLPVSFMHDLHEPQKILVFTDGSCKGPPGKRTAGLGVFWGNDHPWNVAARLKGQQTNNRAEIEACTTALRKANAHGLTNVKIVTDSKFTIHCATEWCFGWQKNDYKLKNGKPVKVREAIKSLVEQLSHPGLHVSWCYSPGHKGVMGNEAADRLANTGADLPYLYNENDDDGDADYGSDENDDIDENLI